MPDVAKPLGILTPMGGGDPVPLRKDEMSVGRRGSCDICLDFENVSGKHCILKLLNGVWHVRDLGSTNGTTVNGQKLDRDRDRGVMPDDELGIAGHFFAIRYDAANAVSNSKQILEAELAEPRRQSFLELAGLEGADDREVARAARPRKPKEAPPEDAPPRRPSAARPAEVAPPAPAPLPLNGGVDDDSGFFRLIKEEIVDDKS